MSLLKNKEKIRSIYVYMIILFACLIFPNPMKGIKDIPMLILGVLGGIYLLWDLFSERQFLKAKYLGLLILSCIFFAISMIVNFDSQWLRNTRALVFGIIFYFILYCCNVNTPKEEIKNQLSIINKIVIIVTFVYGVISLFLFILHIGIIFINPFGDIFPLGWELNRFNGIYGNANVIGPAACISAIISGFELKLNSTGMKKYRIFLISNQIIQLVLLIASASRGSFLMLITTILGIVFPYIYSKKNNFIYTIFKTILIGIISTIGIFIISSFINIIVIKEARTYYVDFSQNGLRFEKVIVEDELSNPTLAQRVLGIENSSEISQTDNQDENKNIPDNENDEVTYSSGRTKIWKSGLQVLKNHTFLGAGLYGLEEHMRDESDLFQGESATLIEQNYIHYFSIHNDFLQAYVSGGLIGGSIFLLLFILIFAYIIKKIFIVIKRKSDNFKELIYYNGLCLGFVASSFFAFVLYFNAGSLGILFWTYLGYTMYFARNVVE